MGYAAVLVLGGPTIGNVGLVEALDGLGIRAALVRPSEARRFVRPQDVAIARLDVRATVDGVEEGLLELLLLERSGARVLNSARSLLVCHDKLLTARRLEREGLPHPRTAHAADERALLALEPPFVVKPRFGSWGRDVMRCRDRAELERCLREIRERSWFRRHGALVQELLPPADRDLRVVVAGGRVVGAAERTAAPGEWRTNVSLGGSIGPAEPGPEACELATRATVATGAALAGVDLYPDASGRWTVLELNGAVEFNAVYSLAGRDVYADLAEALELAGGGSQGRRRRVTYAPVGRPSHRGGRGA